MWGATVKLGVVPLVTDISIHAPRVGSDSPGSINDNPALLFQSTLPVWGATLGFDDYVKAYKAFQSTLPVWGATNTKE